jgi:hypothetical protein
LKYEKRRRRRRRRSLLGLGFLRGGIFKSHGWSDWQEMEVLTNED